MKRQKKSEIFADEILKICRPDTQNPKTFREKGSFFRKACPQGGRGQAHIAGE